MSVNERASWKDGYARGLREGRTRATMRQREADAALVEAVGCNCDARFDNDRSLAREEELIVNVDGILHYHDCPAALADQIRRQP